jgi:hypothetical protein
MLRTNGMASAVGVFMCALIYNVFNGSASSTLDNNYGPQWLQPSLLQDGRMVQFSGMLTF